MDGLVVRAKPAWMLDAACRGMSPSVFFLDPGDGADTRPAKRVCCACPVRRECAEYGRHERYGIWGGNSPGTRVRHRRPSQVA